MIRLAKKLFLFCVLALGYHGNAPAACAPSNKAYGYATTIQVNYAPHEPGGLEALRSTHAEMQFKAVQPTASQTYVIHHRGKHHGHKSSPIGQTVYRRMELNGDKAGLTKALKDLEKKLAQCWLPSVSGRLIKQQIIEVNEMLNSPLITYLQEIRTDDLAVAQAKIEGLWLAISQGESERIPLYDAALSVYVERRDQARIQGEKQAPQSLIAEGEQKIACDNPEEQKPAILISLEQEKQALLKQAKKTPHLFESQKSYRQADLIEARIQALARGAAVLKTSCDNLGKKTPTIIITLEQKKQLLLKQAKRTTNPLERKKLCRQADGIEARIQALALETAASNDSQPMVLHSGIILPDSSHGLPALPALPVDDPVDYNVDYNSDYAYQFDAILTHACQANFAAHAEVDEKVAHEILGLNNNPPMVITDAIALGLQSSVAPLRNEYELKFLLSDAYLDSCAADPEFNHKTAYAICEGLQKAGYAFATKALNPYEFLETTKELGESIVSLVKGAFYLTVGRDIYILSGGKYCMSDAEMRENIYLVIDAIRKIDPSAFSAKQMGEFAGTEGAKMVHTLFLGKIIAVVSKVNMASKARSLVKKLDQVTHAAQAERAVAVTAEGFVVHAAQDARAGLALSEINSASQAEKRVAQAVAGLEQESSALGKASDIGNKSKNMSTVEREAAKIAKEIKKQKINEYNARYAMECNKLGLEGPSKSFLDHVFEGHMPGGATVTRGKSMFNEGTDFVSLALEAWDRGTLIEPGVKLYDYGYPIGLSKSGQTTSIVRVALNKNLSGFRTIYPV